MSDAPKDRDALIEVMAFKIFSRQFATEDFARRKWESLRDEVAEAYFSEARETLEAIESSGCFVGPTFPTVDMAAAGATRCDVGPISTWQAMVSANPYSKE